MTTYALALESGPHRRATMVHVLDLPGCVRYEKTCDAALAAAPDEIRAYLRYLRRHGEKVDPAAAVRTRVAEERLEGGFIGVGAFATDRAPVRPSELARWLRWLEWSRADLLALVDGVDRRALEAKPAGARAIREILLHVLDADKSYLYSVLGAVKSVGGPVNDALHGRLDLRIALREERAAALERLRALTPAERAFRREDTTPPRSTRRAIRRMLEHEWEHRREIARRLDRDA